MPMIRVAAVFKGSPSVEVYFLVHGDVKIPNHDGRKIATVAGVNLVKMTPSGRREWYTAVPVWPRCTRDEFVKRAVAEGWTVYPSKDEDTAVCKNFVGVPDRSRTNQP